MPHLSSCTSTSALLSAYGIYRYFHRSCPPGQSQNYCFLCVLRRRSTQPALAGTGDSYSRETCAHMFFSSVRQHAQHVHFGLDGSDEPKFFVCVHGENNFLFRPRGFAGRAELPATDQALLQQRVQRQLLLPPVSATGHRHWAHGHPLLWLPSPQVLEQRAFGFSA